MSAPPTPLTVWSRAFPAIPAHVRDARRFLATILDGHPKAGDSLLCLSELATNAVVHSRSRHPGGSFTVRVHLDSRHLRVEVCDQGGPWHAPTQANVDEEKGRGLQIVRQVATRWGCEGHSRTGWTVWFEIEARASGQGGR